MHPVARLVMALIVAPRRWVRGWLPDGPGGLRWPALAAVCLIAAEILGGLWLGGRMLEEEIRRTRESAVAQTSILAALAGLGVENGLHAFIGQSPALASVRITDQEGRGVLTWNPGRAAGDFTVARDVVAQDGRSEGQVLTTWSERAQRDEAILRLWQFGLLSVLISLALGGLAIGVLGRHLRRFRATEEATRNLAMRDPLTGIRNRRGLAEVLESQEFSNAWAAGAPVMLALADLDGFKPVNDTHGHAAGDELLKQIAFRLDQEVKHQGIAARLGGDEFALMLRLDPADPHASAEDAAKRLMGVVRMPFMLHPDGVGAGGGSVQVRVGLSLGIALAPEDAEDATELMRRADSALYRAKAEGRGRFRRFTPEMDPRLGARRGAMRLEAELREALAEGRIACHYQPIRQLETGRLIGLEALARWPHAIRGFVSPAEFIPIAEANGLIVPLTQHLLRVACQDAAGWPEPATLSFNLSALHLTERDLPRQIAVILAETGLPAERLQLELTEGALLGDLRAGHAMLSELKATGVRLALDDFGTGHSGLRELHALPFDVIKIDAGFVRAMASDAGARKIVAAIIGLGESLGLPVVAEGIEEQVDVDFLTQLGCDMGQGWLLGRPVPAEQVAPLMLPAPRMAAARQDAA